MCTDRLTRCLGRPSRLWGFSLLVWLGLTACRPASLSTTRETPVLATATITAATAAWQTYRSEQGGYTVEYPATWTVDEQVGANNTLVTTTFTPADGGASITVIVQTALADQAELPQPADIPNTRCEQVTVNRLPGIHCFDTISFSVTTAFMNEKRAYTIAASARRLDQSIYQHFLDSIQVLAWAR